VNVGDDSLTNTLELLVKLLCFFLAIGNHGKNLRPLISWLDFEASCNLLVKNGIFFIDLLKDHLSSNSLSFLLRLLNEVEDLLIEMVNAALHESFRLRLCDKNLDELHQSIPNGKNEHPYHV
jgi:hypothetical protein